LPRQAARLAAEFDFLGGPNKRGLPRGLGWPKQKRQNAPKNARLAARLLNYGTRQIRQKSNFSMCCKEEQYDF
jgi:hypothetical protein